MDIPLSYIKPIYPPRIITHDHPEDEDPSIQETLENLHLQPHPEGGYFVETDRDPHHVLNPFRSRTPNAEVGSDATRPASTTIFYFLTPHAPLGAFHRNRARTIHTWHRGRGRYVVIHADEASNNPKEDLGRAKAPIGSFVVGPDVARGERMQWVVEGGKYKSSFLLPDAPIDDAEDGTDRGSRGLLIAEVVVPGFESADHDFLRREQMDQLLTSDQTRELNWMLKS
ncbi:hypothetical protein NUU61_003963 [Penicillium alfredii]|uniref:DUF985 domain-containing protein n=1 Tax=Penicillium alfredii TaxID=1506179 RepID=A0A9W9FK93_9EURO|nr:uncharacterized protein NUU61_003963 [Penicillium alfredii]KAJ5101741.1 hypothetical protein NUU61_003963 [Penicillium alfredii]